MKLFIDQWVHGLTVRVFWTNTLRRWTSHRFWCWSHRLWEEVLFLYRPVSLQGVLSAITSLSWNIYVACCNPSKYRIIACSKFGSPRHYVHTQAKHIQRGNICAPIACTCLHRMYYERLEEYRRQRVSLLVITPGTCTYIPASAFLRTGMPNTNNTEGLLFSQNAMKSWSSRTR